MATRPQGAGPMVVRGTVTPSRASRFFLPRIQEAPHTPETPALSISFSTPYMPTPSTPSEPDSLRVRVVDSDSDADVPLSPCLGRKRRKMVQEPRIPFALQGKSRGPRWAQRTYTQEKRSTHAFFSRMATRTEHPYYVESTVPHAMASPLCATYMHAARDVDDPLPCLAVGDDEGRIHLLDTQTPSDSLEKSFVKHTTQPLVHGSVFAAEWRSDDHVLAIGGSDYSVSAWDVQHELCVAHYDAHNGSARALAWDPDDRRLLASGARDGAIYLWDLRQSAAAVHIHKAHGMPRTRRGTRVAGVTSLAYVNGQLASSCSENGVVKMWDLRSAQAPRMTSSDLSVGRAGNTRPHGVSSLAYAPTRRRLYAACTDGCVYVLDPSLEADALPPYEPRSLYHAVQRRNTLYARAALYDERYLALGCNTGDIVVWDTDAAHAAVLPLNAVSWMHGPRGPTLASASDDQTVRVWEPGHSV